jgi:hypothetical protein
LTSIVFLPLFSSNAHAGELNLRPIESKPEPLSRLHPDLKWMTQKKVRAIWIGDDLFDKFGDSDKTKGRVLADAGFNLICVGMNVNSDDTPSGVVNTGKPYALKHDRSKSTALETRLAANVAEARRVGVSLMIGWKYGTHHLEPYRKYRSPTQGLARITCCPLEEEYITGQHTGNWAVKITQGGADGIVIDAEMYHSDKADYYGACVCDICFKTYLAEHAGEWPTTYNKVSADDRVAWLDQQNASDHYADYATKRTEMMYDSIRRRCQKINPVFFFGIAPKLYHIPGMERGLGTASVPCLVFSEHEYHHGPYRGSFMGTLMGRSSLPILFLCGAYVAKQSPEVMAHNIIQSYLYTDGWWPWYGTALLNEGNPNGQTFNMYGRVVDTTTKDYLDTITATHERLDEWLKGPKSDWPRRQDGKLNWIKNRLAQAEGDLARAHDDLAKAKKDVSELKTELENYMRLLQ